MEEVCIGSHGPQRTVVLEEEEEKEKNFVVDVGLC
jgi:hypothetical protein